MKVHVLALALIASMAISNSIQAISPTASPTASPSVIPDYITNAKRLYDMREKLAALVEPRDSSSSSAFETFDPTLHAQLASAETQNGFFSRLWAVTFGRQTPVDTNSYSWLSGTSHMDQHKAWYEHKAQLLQALANQTDTDGIATTGIIDTANEYQKVATALAKTSTDIFNNPANIPSHESLLNLEHTFVLANDADISKANNARATLRKAYESILAARSKPTEICDAQGNTDCSAVKAYVEKVLPLDIETTKALTAATKAKVVLWHYPLDWMRNAGSRISQRIGNAANAIGQGEWSLKGASQFSKEEWMSVASTGLKHVQRNAPTCLATYAGYKLGNRIAGKYGAYLGAFVAAIIAENTMDRLGY